MSSMMAFGAVAAGIAACGGGGSPLDSAAGTGYVVTSLVSTRDDAHLVNPWGPAFGVPRT